jgi:hypothetical protein
VTKTGWGVEQEDRVRYNRWRVEIHPHTGFGSTIAFGGGTMSIPRRCSSKQRDSGIPTCAFPRHSWRPGFPASSDMTGFWVFGCRCTRPLFRWRTWLICASQSARPPLFPFIVPRFPRFVCIRATRILAELSSTTVTRHPVIASFPLGVPLR